LPARAFSLAREARRQFRSKKVRIWSNKRILITLKRVRPVIRPDAPSDDGASPLPRTNKEKLDKLKNMAHIFKT